MNKFNLLLAAGLVAAATPAMAEDSKGGFKEVNVITIEEAQNLGDDAYVVLQGNIINKIGDEKYTFQDKTGSITIEIDDDDWDGVDVTPADLVEIQGEVDKGWTSFEIDVDTISKVAPEMKNIAAANN